MSYLHTALSDSREALGALAFPPITLLWMCAIVSLVLSAWKQRERRTRFGRPYHWCALAHLSFFPAAIAVGVFFEAIYFPGRIGFPDVPDRTGFRLYAALVYGSLASCAFWIWRMKGFRWFATSLMIVMELPVLVALLNTGIAVTGDAL